MPFTPFKITVTHEVGEQFFKDLMVTMVEQPYGWFAFKSITRTESLYITSFEVHEYDEDEPNGGINFDDPEGWETITFLTIAETIKEVLEKRPFSDDLIAQIERSVAENDADIDANAADCLLQWAVFGEVRYG